MSVPSLARVITTVSRVALALVLVCASGTVPFAQMSPGRGLITAVDLATGTLVLDTQSGPRQIRVAQTATIRSDHDVVLSIRDLRPGDAVVYLTASDTATSLRVARQFWAIPRER